jgi:transcriptional regulator with XRE-family HTH domain
MISQPELGKRIVELRKMKGLTQEELIEKCNLSVRTLQRIESGEVTPRNSTIKLIFEALGISPLNYFESTLDENDNEFKNKWYKQLYINFIDLFHLRTHTMKKITILAIFLLVILNTIYLVNRILNTQSKPLPQIQRSTGVK